MTSASWPDSGNHQDPFAIASGYASWPIEATAADAGLMTAPGPDTSALNCWYYRTSSPVTARAMIMRWISDVPSKIVKIFASRCQRSTGKSRV